MKPLMILLTIISAAFVLLIIVITRPKQQTMELDEIKCKSNKELYMPEFPFVFFSS